MLEPMLVGRGRALHAGGQRTLATWALKTAMMVEHSHGAVRHVTGEAEYAHLYERREPSDRVRMWMAAYGGDVTAMGRMFGLDADMTTGPDPDRGARDIWGVTVTFGPVVFQLFGANIPELLQALNVRVPGCHQLWPFAGSFTWTPRPAFDDHQLVAFADGFLYEVKRMSRRGPGESLPEDAVR